MTDRSLLKELLFLPKASLLGHSGLFSDIKDLSQSISSCTPDSGELRIKSAKSLAAYLAQIFRLERPISTVLSRAIEAAMITRLRLNAPDCETGPWCKELATAIESHQEMRRTRQRDSMVQSESDYYDELLGLSRAAKFQFIVTPFSLEQETYSKRADELRTILVDRLGLTPRRGGAYRSSQDSTESIDDLPTYAFVLPSRTSAQSFWANLYREVTQNKDKQNQMNPDEAANHLQSLDDHDKLQVFLALNPAICCLPIVVFEPNTKRDEYCAFSFRFDAADRLRIIKWDKDISNIFVLHYFRNFEHGLPEVSVERYHWKEARTRLRRV